jgi:hypothetical protein
MDDAFDILQLPMSASLEEIDKKWKTLVLTVHPDKIGAEEGTKKTQILNEAHHKARQMYHESECSWARFLQQQHGNINTEDANKYKDEQWIKEMLAAHLAEERAHANAAKLKWEEDLKRKVSQAVTPYMTQAYKDEVRIEELNTSLETERIRADKAENLAEECIQIAERETKHLEKAYVEIQTKDTQLRELLHQNKEKDLLIHKGNLKHAETTTELDHTQKQLAKSEQKQVILEETLSTLQTLLEKEKERTEIAENKAKEWERKYNEIRPEATSNDTECIHRKKRKHGKHFETQEADTEFKNSMESFLQSHLQVSENTFLSTKRIKEVFTKSVDQTPNDQLFCKNLRSQIQTLFPTVTPGVQKQERGYSGITFKDG